MYLGRPRRIGDSHGVVGNRAASGFGASLGGLNSNSPINSQSFAQSSGDIVLTHNNVGKKKNKQKIFIFLGVGCAVVLLVLVLVGVFNKTSEASTLQKFDIFMNYMLFGRDASESVPRGNTLDAVIYDNFQNESSEYFQKLKSLYDDFYDSYNKRKNQYSQWARLEVDQNKSEFDFIVALQEVGFLDTDKLLASFLAKEDIEDKETEAMAVFDRNAARADNYVIDRLNYVTMYSKYLKEMSVTGCIMNDELDMICSDRQPLSQDANPRADKYGRILTAIRDSETGVVGSFVADCFDVRDILVNDEKGES